MNYRHPEHRIHEIVQSPKCLNDGQTFTIKSTGEHSAHFTVDLALLDGPFLDIRYTGRAGRTNIPSSYDASLLLEQQRVRGVGYCAVERQNFRAKLRIPKGWHQNICDPNVATNHPAWNRHEPLADFAPTDFSHFIQLTSNLWNIDLNREEELL
ncbi:hypothetical protein OH491_03160 [Termitidicoccus mucosus]|uniref:Uncharacterized protein n=1 Tax=Termitidicoccus mucosus TaxID=1184151 RepID=A0A178IM24_9BACT|nr:hypothetical protein AW736_06400 [Opitutaceae bacterium TSB47]